jgi:hypothetical protein
MVENDKKLHLELVMPHNHCANKAERSIQTAKTHIIATLASANPDFSMAASKHIME